MLPVKPAGWASNDNWFAVRKALINLTPPSPTEGSLSCSYYSPTPMNPTTKNSGGIARIGF